MSSAAYEYRNSVRHVKGWYKKISAIAAITYTINSQEKIGGPGQIVEIDESMLLRNKYRKGRKLSGQTWVLEQ